jgi:hypothetical protein
VLERWLHIETVAQGYPRDFRKMAGYVIPTALAGAHVYAMYTQYERMVGVDDPLKGAETWWTTPAAASTLYLVGVYAGKRIMESRKAFDLKPAMDVYNAYLCLLSLAMFLGLVRDTLWAGEPIWTLAVNRGAEKSALAFWMWVNMQSKYLEFMDTLFMILRKKNEQISFLHVSHHFVMGPVMWTTVAFAPGGSRWVATAGHDRQQARTAGRGCAGQAGQCASTSSGG